MTRSRIATAFVVSVLGATVSMSAVADELEDTLIEIQSNLPGTWVGTSMFKDIQTGEVTEARLEQSYVGISAPVRNDRSGRRRQLASR